MKVPVEISYREIDKTEAIDALIHEKLAKLEKFCDHISSCHIAIEKIHDHPKSGSPYRVRLDITVPPGHEIAAVSNPDEGNQYKPLEAVIRDAFEAARRQLVKLNEKQHDQIKAHPQQAMKAVVTKLFPEQGYGFLKTTDTGREIYFQRNSVANDDFERIKVGTGVQYSEIEGEMGPQATTIHIVDQPGFGSTKEGDESVEPPLGWK
jgi:ribosomal subunit interface protein